MKQIESFNREISSLRQDVDRLNTLNRQLEAERQELESSLLWTKDTLSKTEARERKVVEDMRSIEFKYQSVQDQKVFKIIKKAFFE